MKFLIITILFFICISCTTTKYVDKPVPVETIKTEYINKVYRDTIIERDSIDRFIKGDTLMVYKYKYRYKYLTRTDTIAKTDSIEVPVEVKTVKIKEVNKLKWYQSALMWVGGVALIILILLIGKKLRTKK